MRYVAFFSLAVFVLLFSGCAELEEPELVEIVSIKLMSMEGSKAKIAVDAEIENPNGFNIKVKPSTLDVFVDDEKVGTVDLLNEIKLVKKKSQVYAGQFSLNGEKGIMLKLMQWMNKETIKVRFTGKLKASVLGITKKVPVTKTKYINTADFKGKVKGL